MALRFEKLDKYLYEVDEINPRFTAFRLIGLKMEKT